MFLHFIWPHNKTHCAFINYERLQQIWSLNAFAQFIIFILEKLVLDGKSCAIEMNTLAQWKMKI